jgi:hypothetical protein
MPVINPARLAKQMEDLFSQINDPVAFRRQCLDLLEFYADRTRRPGVSKGMEDTGKVFNVQPPILRALSSGLSGRLQGNPSLSGQIAAELWAAGYRETRLLAASIVGWQDRAEVAELAEQWVTDCEDRQALSELASSGIAGWRKADMSGFLERVSLWLDQRSRRLRHFALMALKAAVEDSSFEDLPTVFRILAGVVDKVRGESRQSLFELVRAMARRSPPETARFLLDELAHDSVKARHMIRSTLEAFPAHQQELLELALST